MIKVDFDSAFNVASNIETLKTNFSQVSSSCNRIDVGKVSTFSPGAVSKLSEIKSALNNLSNITDTYHSNYLFCINKYQELFQLVGENINKMFQLAQYKEKDIDMIDRGKLKEDGYFIIGPSMDGKMLKAVVLDKDGNERIVYTANTKINCFDYSKYANANGLFQDGKIKGGKGGILGDECMMLCKYYIVDMLSGTFTSKKFMTSNSRDRGVEERINNPKTIICDSNDPNDKKVIEAKSEINEFIYNELREGRPVVLQVTQEDSSSDNGGKRHFVVITGFDDTVKGPEDLNPDTMYSLDCLDGDLNFLSSSGSQPNGRDLFSDGNFQALGASDGFLNDEVYGEAGKNFLESWTNRGYATILNQEDRLYPDFRRIPI